MENNNVGDWGQIGYSAPGARTSSAEYTSNNIHYTEEDNNVWQAEPKTGVTLNECDNGETWTLTPTKKTNTTTTATYVEFQAAGSGVCTSLTPSFLNLTRTGDNS